jgi:hypothetical protein
MQQLIGVLSYRSLRLNYVLPPTATTILLLLLQLLLLWLCLLLSVCYCSAYKHCSQHRQRHTHTVHNRTQQRWLNARLSSAVFCTAPRRQKKNAIPRDTRVSKRARAMCVCKHSSSSCSRGSSSCSAQVVYCCCWFCVVCCCCCCYARAATTLCCCVLLESHNLRVKCYTTGGKQRTVSRCKTCAQRSVAAAAHDS